VISFKYLFYEGAPLHSDVVPPELHLCVFVLNTHIKPHRWTSFAHLMYCGHFTHEEQQRYISMRDSTSPELMRPLFSKEHFSEAESHGIFGMFLHIPATIYDPAV